MKKKIIASRDFARGLVKHPLFSGSAVMIIGSNFTNLLAYIYHLTFGRLLGPSDYGELASSISLITMFTVAFTFLGMVIVKFVSASKENEVSAIFSWFTKKAIIAGLVLSLILVLLTPVFSNFLHTDIKVILLIGPIFFVFLLVFIYKAFLQGLLKFGKLVVIGNLEMFIRFLAGLLLIIAGLRVFGAMLGILLGSVVSLIIASLFLRNYKILKTKDKFNGGGEILKYSLPVFVASVASNSFFTSDVLLAKHFFSPHEAGLYASLSTLGKIIFYGTAPVSAVMFPMISQRFAKKESFRKIFILSFLLTLMIIAGVLVVYLFLPKLAILVLFGEKYLEGAPNLFAYGLFMGIFALASLIVSYFLSINKTKAVIFPLIFAVVQVIGIFLFHQSTITLIHVSVVSVSLLLISLVLYAKYG